MKKYDYLIVGSGIYGSVMARQLTDKGYTVLVIDKRNHIGGNVYTENINGINVHRYGAHIFHTNNEEVWNYVQKFANFNRFTNSPIANYKGEIYSLPFNMHTFNKMWGIVTPEEAKTIIETQRNECNIKEPQNLEEQAISLIGKDVYEKLVKGYTEKQWGRKCVELPTSIIKRLPVRFTYDCNYFNAMFQGIPIGGYTRMIEKMLDGIEIRLGIDYLERKKEFDIIANKVIFTGSIDSYYDYKFGCLEYRSVVFETEILETENYQGNAVVNYTSNDIPYTRIIEHKWFEFGKDLQGNAIPQTVISKEFSVEWEKGIEPYYPIANEKNEKLYSKYKSLADKETKVIFGGRLGEYKYYDMDRAIESALELSKRL